MAIHDHMRPGTVRWHSVRLPAGRHLVGARVFTPATPPEGWLVWAHGGSWRAGSVAGWHGATADLARHSGCAVVSVEYRLSPGHRHPAALADVLTAVDWAFEQAGAAGAVAVGGDSAGGTLAAAAALACRDRARPLAAQVLAYPPLDPVCDADSYTRYQGNFPTPQAMVAAWQDYRAPGRPVAEDGTRLYSTPFEAADLRGLAPALLAVGEFDPVADDVRRYRELLLAAGVRAELREFPQTFHGAFLDPGQQPPSTAEEPGLRPWLGTALRARLARGAR
ncbi:alpha/beta hydrolase fold domain-containing protein [Kitasatospora sp. NBC_01302]|uniref:alpha/beta hydrolase fold domain-containing protein n=1 Tax=Kitasatospora sp. NBC_01302 TaxID=2903575 RepID=UPI002E0E9021|nr:alpha/beta hydrolase [Kitasatospora sp. NBC_01302]